MGEDIEGPGVSEVVSGFDAELHAAEVDTRHTDEQRRAEREAQTLTPAEYEAGQEANRKRWAAEDASKAPAEDRRLSTIRTLRAMGALHATVDGISVTWAGPPTATLATPAVPPAVRTPEELEREKALAFERTLFRSSG